MKRKLFGHLNRKTLNIIIGGILFLIFSSGYDIFIGDRSSFRYIVLGVGIIIIILAIALRIINSGRVKKIMGRQMGD